MLMEIISERQSFVFPAAAAGLRCATSGECGVRTHFSKALAPYLLPRLFPLMRFIQKTGCS